MTVEAAIAIKHWIQQVTSRAHLVDAIEDVHIDDLHSSYASKHNWIDGGMEILGTAADTLKEMKFKAVVLLAFHLKASRKPAGMSINSKKSLLSQCDRTPPSIYLISPGAEQWLETPKEKLPQTLFIHMDELTCYFSEIWDPRNSNYKRTLWYVLET